MVHGEPCCKINRYRIHKYSHVEPWIMTSAPRYLGVPYRTLFSQGPKIPHRWKQPSLSLTGYSTKYLLVLLYPLRNLCDTVSPAKIKGHGVTKVIFRQGLINVIISIIISLPSIYLLGSAVFQKKKRREIQKPKTRNSIPYPLAS